MVTGITGALLIAHMIDIDDGTHLICSCGNFHESYTGSPAGTKEGHGGDSNLAWVEWVNHIMEVAAGGDRYTQGRLN